VPDDELTNTIERAWQQFYSARGTRELDPQMVETLHNFFQLGAIIGVRALYNASQRGSPAVLQLVTEIQALRDVFLKQAADIRADPLRRAKVEKALGREI
jgi:hypothetical protein